MSFELSSAVTQPAESNEPTGLACLVIVARRHGLHLTAAQLIHDNVLPVGEVSAQNILKSAKTAGMTAKVVRLDWGELGNLKNALPAIVRLKDGSYMVLTQVDSRNENKAQVTLRDPKAAEDVSLVIDRIRFEDVWDGNVILVKRNYDIADVSQPFGLSMILALILRERRVVRDLGVSALVLGLFAICPVMFWRLLSDRVLYYQAFDTFYVLCAAMLVIVAFEAAFAYIRQLMVNHVTVRLDVKLSTYVFAKLLNLPIDFFERSQVGTIARDVREIERIRKFLTGQLFGTVLDSTMLLFIIPIMFFFSATMTFIVLGMSGLIVLWLLLMLPVYRERSNAVVAAASAEGAFLVQTLNGIRTVKSLALDARQRHVWDILVARTAKARMAEGSVANLIQAVVRPMERFAISGAFGVGVYMVLVTNSSVYMGALYAFLILSQRVTGPLMQMAQLINTFDEARLAVDALGRLVNQEPEEGRSGHGVRVPLKGHVEFSGVTFRYKGAVSPALNRISFEIPAGGKLGVMGKSGSGKTTITRLLQRLHSDYDGLIKIDGVDVREYDVDHLRQNVGVVLQENFLFSGTIRENISAAKPDATFDEVVRAARLAGAEEFIDKLARGYETYIYEGSSNLSGGQRQRLAIARALIVNPPILILDEATSALDADSEAIVNANINRIAQGRTLIIISHRLSSLVDCDAILVLNRGEVNDIGRHEELLERNEIYSGLWNQQNSHALVSRRGRGNYGGPSLVS